MSVVEPEPPEAELDSERLVLVADADEARGKETSDAIRTWGLTPLLVHDGVEAMLTIQRTLPAVIVLDAGLPKMFGFQVCEVVKRNESLCHIKVVLVGSVHHEDRYRRAPSETYGADVLIESLDLPDGLYPVLQDAGLAVENSTPSTTPSPKAPSAPSPPPVEEDPERTAERERALRLARIAVSEMVLYQPEKFDQAMRQGKLEQALDLEIQEARALLRQRVSEEVREEKDFIIDELHRVARERGEEG